MSGGRWRIDSTSHRQSTDSFLEMTLLPVDSEGVRVTTNRFSSNLSEMTGGETNELYSLCQGVKRVIIGFKSEDLKLKQPSKCSETVV